MEDGSGRIGDAYEKVAHIPGDHREMVRFGSARETGYQRVLDVVQDFVAGATDAVSAGQLPRQLTPVGA